MGHNRQSARKIHQTTRKSPSSSWDIAYICMVSLQYVSTITICTFVWFLSSMCPLSQYAAHIYGFSPVCVHYHNMRICMVSLQYVSFVWFLSSMCHLCGGRQITTTPSPLLLLELPCPPRPTVDFSWHFITHLYMSLFQFAILCTIQLHSGHSKIYPIHCQT